MTVHKKAFMNEKIKYNGMPPRSADIQLRMNVSTNPTWVKNKIMPTPTCQIGRLSGRLSNHNTFLNALRTSSATNKHNIINTSHTTGTWKTCNCIKLKFAIENHAVTEHVIANASSTFWITLLIAYSPSKSLSYIIAKIYYEIVL